MNLTFGFFAPQEQYDPRTLLDHAILAERYGFDRVWTSDHFHPWFHSGASSAFSWVWIAAAAERTTSIKLGTGVTAPILRYHPAIVAQAFATLGKMYPNRIFLGVGTGEPMNEVPLGYKWPKFNERLERLEEAVRVIHSLWTGDFVTFRGKYYSLRAANLYCRPSAPIPMYIAASGPRVAEVAGKCADGILVGSADVEYIRGAVLPALDAGARLVGRDPNTIDKAVHFLVSYDEDLDRAIENSRIWAGSLLPAMFKYPISNPKEIEKLAMLIGKESILKSWVISSDIREHLDKARDLIKLGFNHISFSSLSPNQEKFIKVFGNSVLPELRKEFAGDS